MNSIKQSIKSEILNQLELKIQEITDAIKSAEISRDADSKSSAGDKHETSRAKIQTEIDQLSKQLFNAQKQKNDLLNIDTDQTNSLANVGSLVETNKGYFYISIGWGRIQMQNENYFVISLGSPIGMLLKNKKKGDSFQFRNTEYCILNLS
ncbi:MAG: 3-oxoacyl-ACP synthase [Crocinitomicaceae bacterium]|nr:3-oxoacyl-ACP synthase [Crocinitomicaceae bacterium]